MGGDVLPSAKTRAAKAQILVWLEEDPTAKIIIYTQFIPMIRILEKVCKTERWPCLKYTGNMSHDARAHSINEFADDPKKKIMLASLKAGGLGLNLTMASRVLLLDPWCKPIPSPCRGVGRSLIILFHSGNNAVEQQAFARVYRIGQVKETQLTRLVITNTVDTAMMAVKARKNAHMLEILRLTATGAQTGGNRGCYERFQKAGDAQRQGSDASLR